MSLLRFGSTVRLGLDVYLRLIVFSSVAWSTGHLAKAVFLAVGCLSCSSFEDEATSGVQYNPSVIAWC